MAKTPKTTRPAAAPTVASVSSPATAAPEIAPPAPVAPAATVVDGTAIPAPIEPTPEPGPNHQQMEGPDSGADGGTPLGSEAAPAFTLTDGELGLGEIAIAGIPISNVPGADLRVPPEVPQALGPLPEIAVDIAAGSGEGFAPGTIAARLAEVLPEIAGHGDLIGWRDYGHEVVVVTSAGRKYAVELVSGDVIDRTTGKVIS